MLGREAAITRLLKDLRVKPRIRTDIVDVTYSAPDPHFAQQVVNHVVDIFRSASAEAAQQGSRRRREFLEGQLKVNDSLLADARQAGDLDTAIPLCGRALQANPQGTEAKLGLGQSYLTIGASNEAAAQFR